MLDASPAWAGAGCRGGAPGALLPRDRLELMGGPADSGHCPGAVDCGAAVAGLGPRLYLLGSEGLYCARLLTWSERLRTLQVGLGFAAGGLVGLGVAAGGLMGLGFAAGGLLGDGVAAGGLVGLGFGPKPMGGAGDGVWGGGGQGRDGSVERRGVRWWAGG